MTVRRRKGWLAIEEMIGARLEGEQERSKYRGLYSFRRTGYDHRSNALYVFSSCQEIESSIFRHIFT